MDRDPAGDDLAGGGVDDGLTGAEGEADGEEEDEGVAGVRGEEGGEGGGDTPPDGAEGEDAARAEAGDEGAGGELEAGVAEEEGGEDPAEALIGEVEVAGDGEAGDGDIGAVEEGDGAEEEEPRAEEIADVRAAAGGHDGPGFLSCSRQEVWRDRMECVGQRAGEWGLRPGQRWRLWLCCSTVRGGWDARPVPVDLLRGRVTGREVTHLAMAGKGTAYAAMTRRKIRRRMEGTRRSKDRGPASVYLNLL